MTPEQEQEIKDLKDKLHKLTDEHPNLGIFVIIDARDYEEKHWVFCGNLCPACAVEHSLAWAIDTQVQHHPQLTKH